MASRDWEDDQRNQGRWGDQQEWERSQSADDPRGRSHGPRGYGEHSRHWGGSDSGSPSMRGYGDERHGSGPAQGPGAGGISHHDEDYQKWRDEQMRNLDAEYHSWRQDRYRKFADEFNSWRASRSGGQGQNTGVAPGTSSSGGGWGSSAAGASSTGTAEGGTTKGAGDPTKSGG